MEFHLDPKSIYLVNTILYHYLTKHFESLGFFNSSSLELQCAMSDTKRVSVPDWLLCFNSGKNETDLPPDLYIVTTKTSWSSCGGDWWENNLKKKTSKPRQLLVGGDLFVNLKIWRPRSVGLNLLTKKNVSLSDFLVFIKNAIITLARLPFRYLLLLTG